MKSSFVTLYEIVKKDFELISTIKTTISYTSKDIAINAKENQKRYNATMKKLYLLPFFSPKWGKRKQVEKSYSEGYLNEVRN